jgi:deazaflavin-dependent oxidoreductase (nitroreductase family)
VSMNMTPPGGTYGARVPPSGFRRFGSRMMSGIYRLFGGRGVANLLLLTTTGARSGEPRTTPVRRFDDGDGRWLVVASAQGSARHPAWLHNLVAHPDDVWVEIGHDRTKVRPELLDAIQRAEAWKRVVAEAPEFGKYETTTDREIPVVRLTRQD